MRVHSENLVWGEQQILAKLQEMYAAADCREHLKTALRRRFVSERGVFIIPVDPVQGFLGGFCVNGR